MVTGITLQARYKPLAEYILRNTRYTQWSRWARMSLHHTQFSPSVSLPVKAMTGKLHWLRLQQRVLEIHIEDLQDEIDDIWQVSWKGRLEALERSRAQTEGDLKTARADFAEHMGKINVFCEVRTNLRKVKSCKPYREYGNVYFRSNAEFKGLACLNLQKKLEFLLRQIMQMQNQMSEDNIAQTVNEEDEQMLDWLDLMSRSEECLSRLDNGMVNPENWWAGIGMDSPQEEFLYN